MHLSKGEESRYFAHIRLRPWRIVVTELRVDRSADRSSPFQKYAYRDTAHEGRFSHGDVSNSPSSRAFFAYPLQRAVITFVLITLAVRIRPAFVPAGEERQPEKNGLRESAISPDRRHVRAQLYS